MILIALLNLAPEECNDRRFDNELPRYGKEKCSQHNQNWEAKIVNTNHFSIYTLQLIPRLVAT